jgi:hypothetical protein
LLAGNRYDIGVARQQRAAAVRRADRRVEVGLAVAGAAPAAGDAAALQIIGDPADQIEIRARRGRVERDEAIEDLDRCS